MELRTLHKKEENSGLILKCPWCAFSSPIGEFSAYHHPHEMGQEATGSTQCGQCSAAGYTALFVLSYDPQAELGRDEEYRELFLCDLDQTPHGWQNKSVLMEG